jgi:hypothetical protein
MADTDMAILNALFFFTQDWLNIRVMETEGAPANTQFNYYNRYE